MVRTHGDTLFPVSSTDGCLDHRRTRHHGFFLRVHPSPQRSSKSRIHVLHRFLSGKSGHTEHTCCRDTHCHPLYPTKTRTIVARLLTPRQNIYYGTLYAYTPEVLPSAHRGTGNGIAIGFNRIMGIMSAVVALYVFPPAPPSPVVPFVPAAARCCLRGLVKLPHTVTIQSHTHLEGLNANTLRDYCTPCRPGHWLHYSCCRCGVHIFAIVRAELARFRLTESQIRRHQQCSAHLYMRCTVHRHVNGGSSFPIRAHGTAKFMSNNTPKRGGGCRS